MNTDWAGHQRAPGQGTAVGRVGGVGGNPRLLGPKHPLPPPAVPPPQGTSTLRGTFLVSSKKTEEACRAEAGNFLSEETQIHTRK